MLKNGSINFDPIMNKHFGQIKKSNSILYKTMDRKTHIKSNDSSKLINCNTLSNKSIYSPISTNGESDYFNYNSTRHSPKVIGLNNFNILSNNIITAKGVTRNNLDLFYNDEIRHTLRSTSSSKRCSFSDYSKTKSNLKLRISSTFTIKKLFDVKKEINEKIEKIFKSQDIKDDSQRFMKKITTVKTVNNVNSLKVLNRKLTSDNRNKFINEINLEKEKFKLIPNNFPKYKNRNIKIFEINSNAFDLNTNSNLKSRRKLNVIKELILNKNTLFHNLNSKK